MLNKKILITGGAGYIGSHTNAILNALGLQTLVLDNLIYGHKEALSYAPLALDSKASEFITQLASDYYGKNGKKANNNDNNSQQECHNTNTANTNTPAKAPNSNKDNSHADSNNTATATLIQNLTNASHHTTFIESDLSDKDSLKKIFATHNITAVIHFAAFAYVGESVTHPAKYYRNNIANTLNLLEVMQEFGTQNIIFSSTCATYGNPLHLPITESHPQSPINPYGYSKLVVENMLKDFSHAYGLKYVILRYFNAAGASNLFNIGESHAPETHLIPLILQTALGRRGQISVFGDDYPTKDGSCVRDYIHVDDLSAAHILALSYLQNGGKSDVFNLGNASGFSVFEVLKCASEICGKPIKHSIEKRREGDPAVLIGDSSKAKEILGFKPCFHDLSAIIESALRWHANARY